MKLINKHRLFLINIFPPSLIPLSKLNSYTSYRTKQTHHRNKHPLKSFFKIKSCGYEKRKTLIHSYKGGDTVREIEVFIDTEEIAEFFFQELLKRGYVPAEEELEELADITFEYLVEKSIIDEEVSED